MRHYVGAFASFANNSFGPLLACRKIRRILGLIIRSPDVCRKTLINVVELSFLFFLFVSIHRSQQPLRKRPSNVFCFLDGRS